MLKKFLLSFAAVGLLLVPTVAGAYHYYYSDAGYGRVVYTTQEVAEYVPYRKYVCDDVYAPRYNEYGYYGYGYSSHRNCYYKTDYRLETRTIQVPVREYVEVAAPRYTHYEYPAARTYTYSNNYYRPSYRSVEYYGYYYDI